MEHQKHSSEYIDSLIDNVYWNYKVIGESFRDYETYSYNHHQIVELWLVITLKNGYKLGDNMTGSIYQKYLMMNNLYYELKRKLMYSLDYISYILLHKDMSLIKNEDLDKMKLAKSLYELSLKEGRLIH